MEKGSDSCWRITIDDIHTGTNYYYRLENAIDRPDPASNFQPEGVHGASQVIDHNLFQWEDENWRGLPIEEMIIYELHVGTFTHEGTFDAVIHRLDDLSDLGINAINIMPVAQFPGERNWGYDGTYPYAVHNSYGGPEGLKNLVNSCHKLNMAVILDVVYNHLGPEGNYLNDFAPYFTDKYQTPWGSAVNFDDVHSDEVRNYFIENALFWFQHYHIDALRLDAIHSIHDMSAKPFLLELAEKVEDFSRKHGRKHYLTAESDLNDVRVLRPGESGGFGIDAQWNDDFHHSLHALLTGEKIGYYQDFGKIEHFTKALREGFVYSWQYSHYRKRKHGSSSKNRPACQFIVFSQNHDQVGNRITGDRLTKIVSFDALKLAAGAVLFSPYIPLLFMGEEYGEDAPFLYFTSHSGLKLTAAVYEGRKKKLSAFQWTGEPPDPQSTETFFQSRLQWEKRKESKHKVLLQFYRRLIELRRNILAFSNLNKDKIEVSGMEEKKLVLLWRWNTKSQVLCIMNFNTADIDFRCSLPGGRWKKIVDSSDRDWLGSGSLMPLWIKPGQDVTIRAHSLALYEMKTAI